MPHGQGFALDQTDLLAPLAELAVALDVPILTHTSEPVGHRLPRQGRGHAPDRAAPGDQPPRAEADLRPLGRRPALLRADAGGRRRGAPTSGTTRAASPYLYDRRVYAAVRGADRRPTGSCSGPTSRCCGSTAAPVRSASPACRPTRSTRSWAATPRACCWAILRRDERAEPADLRRDRAAGGGAGPRSRRRRPSCAARSARRAGSVRWVNPDGAHLTLKFLGDTPESAVPGVEAALRAAPGRDARPSSCGPARSAASRAAAQPRVLWLGLDGDLAPLTAARDAVEAAIAPLGWPTRGAPVRAPPDARPAAAGGEPGRAGRDRQGRRHDLAPAADRWSRSRRSA